MYNKLLDDERYDGYKAKIKVLQRSINKVIKENATLRLRLEELESQESSNCSFIKNQRLASAIAKREYKTLKIYQECAEEVKCIICKIQLPTNLFYNHECIQHLIGCEDCNDALQNDTSMNNCSSREYKTPLDDGNHFKSKNRSNCSPICFNTINFKKSCYCRSSLLKFYCISDSKNFNENDIDIDKNYITDFSQNKVCCNSFYESDNLKSKLIPSSLHSKYNIIKQKCNKQMPEQILQYSKSSLNLSDTRAHLATSKFEAIKCNKKLSHAMSEIKIPLGSKISRNFNPSESDRTLKASFGDSIAKIENHHHNRSRIKQLNLYESSEASKTIDTVKIDSSLKNQNLEENGCYPTTASFNYQFQASPKGIVASLLKSDEKSKNKCNSKPNITRVHKKFEVVSPNIEKSINTNPISKAIKYNAKSKNKLIESTSNIHKLIEDEDTNSRHTKFKVIDEIENSKSIPKVEKVGEKNDTFKTEIHNRNFTTKPAFLFHNIRHK